MRKIGELSEKIGELSGKIGELSRKVTYFLQKIDEFRKGFAQKVVNLRQFCFESKGLCTESLKV